MIDIRNLDNTYIVFSSKDGNKATIQFDSIDKVADYVENEPNVLGVWKVTSVKLPPEVYARRSKKK